MQVPKITLLVTFKFRLGGPTYDATVTVPAINPRVIREALADQIDTGLRGVDLLHVKILNKTMEEDTL